MRPRVLFRAGETFKPIPKWKERWCNYYRSCVGGKCQEDGSCECSDYRSRRGSGIFPPDKPQLEYYEPGECVDFFITKDAFKRAAAVTGGLVAIIILLVVWKKSRDVRRLRQPRSFRRALVCSCF
jgi:hypothetical protein